MDNKGWWNINSPMIWIDNQTFDIEGDHRDEIVRLGKMRFKVNGNYGYWHTEEHPIYNPTTNKTRVKNVQNSDFLMLNMPTLTEFAYSYISEPRGWPKLFAYGPSFQGFSKPPLTISRFSIENGKLWYYQDILENGISNSELYKTDMPIKSGDFARNMNFAAACVDNNQSLDPPGCVDLRQNNKWVNVHKFWDIDTPITRWTPTSYKAAAFVLECDL